MYSINQVRAIAVLFFVFSWLTVSLRIYVRGFMMKTWGLDDTFMFATMLPFTVYLSCQFIAAEHGTGVHRWEVSDNDARIALLAWWVGEVVYVVANTFLKLSIGFFYLRIAQKPWHVWCIKLLMAGNVLFGFIYFFLVVFQCRPVAEFWNNHPASSKCFSTAFAVGITYAIGSVNAAADWALGLLPFFIVWDLKMERKTKALVAGILAFAAIGSTGTVVRLFYIPTITNGKDFLWATTGVAVWTTVEVGIGVTAGSIATLRPLFRRWLACIEPPPPARHSRSRSVPDSKEKRHCQRAFRRSVSPSDLMPTELTGTTAATFKSYSSEPIYYEDVVLSSRTAPERVAPILEDEEYDIDIPPAKLAKSSGNWDDRSVHEEIREVPETDEDTEEEEVIVGPPRVHLRDSFRNSLNMGSIFNNYRGMRLPD